MILHGVLAEGGEEVDELAAFGFSEAGAGAYVLELAGVVVQAEEERTDEGVFAAFVPAKAGDDAVAVALVLDLEHGPLVGLIDAAGCFGDDAVEARTFEAAEPVFGLCVIPCGGCEVERRLGAGEHLLETLAACAEGLVAEVVVAGGEEVKEDDAGRGLAGKQLDAALGGVDALGECVEVEAMGAGDDNLAIEDALRRELGEERGAEFGEVAVERLGVAALDQEVVPGAEDEGAKAVPLGLEEPVAGGGDGIDALGEHGEDRVGKREGHNMA